MYLKPLKYPSKHFICFYFTLIIFVTISFKVRAQNIDSIAAAYSSEYPQERIHVHFDRSVYFPGDTIWFKAYLMTGLEVAALSRSIYFDWVDSSGTIIAHQVYPVAQSSAEGQFTIPAAYKNKSILLHAYTKWMLNFDASFLYDKTMRVAQTDYSATAVNSNPKIALQLFPEGGDLVDSLVSTVAFKAIDEHGMPATIKGVIKNNHEELIDSLITEHDGMGKFQLQPFAGETYSVSWADEQGILHNTDLPVAKQTGAILKVSASGSKIIFFVQKSFDNNINLKHLHLVAQIHQNVLYNAAIDLSTATQTTGSIPTANLPSGIIQFTLLDATMQPLAERVVFLNNGNFNFAVTAKDSSLNITPKARNSIEINIPDTMVANLSLAVTDGDLYDDNSDNIVSNVLLTGDLKGYVHNPSYYFSGTADSIKNNLDLVMLTNGWRRFKWEEVSKGKVPIITYPLDTGYLNFTGKVFGASTQDLQNAKNIMAVISAVDSSRQLLIMPLNADGTFEQNDLVFYDTLKVYYKFAGKKTSLTSSSEVQFGNSAFPSPKQYKFSMNAVRYSIIDTTGNYMNSLKAEAEKNRLADLMRGSTLKGVTVTARAKSQQQLTDEKYTTGLFSGGNARKFDLTEDKAAAGSISVISYLQGLVAGLQIDRSGSTTGTPSVKWRGQTPDFFIDEISVDISQVLLLSMPDVAYIKAFPPPFLGSFGGGGGGAIAVYTRKGGDIQTGTQRRISYQTAVGYTFSREFYSPVYSPDSLNNKPDTRTTLLWQPTIIKDAATHSIKIPFYNNDFSKTLRLVIEGVNSEGKLVRIDKLLE